MIFDLPKTIHVPEADTPAQILYPNVRTYPFDYQNHNKSSRTVNSKCQKSAPAEVDVQFAIMNTFFRNVAVFSSL